MKARTLLVSIGITSLLTAAPLALQACSSDSPVTTGNQTDGSTNDTGAITTRPDTSTPQGDSSTPGTDAGGDDSSTPGTDSSTPTGDAADIPDGGEPSTPGHVQCGATNCDVSANTCCFEADAAATCASGASATCSSTAATLHCLETADCTGGQLCCGAFDLISGKATTTCKAGPCTADLSHAQFCRTNSECPSGERCIVQSCTAGNAPAQTLELCGATAHAGCTAK